MTAWSRARTRRRRARAVALAVLAVPIAALWPTAASAVAGFVDREILAEARGDTAQALATKLGWEIARDPIRPDRLVVAPNGTGQCDVRPLIGVQVSCSATVTYTTLPDGGFTVTVQRRSDTFIWSSAEVLGASS